MPGLDWNAESANLLKSELKRRGITYGQLVEKLAEIGVNEKEVNVRNKLSRGTFTTAYLLQCMAAIGANTVHLNVR